MNVRVEDDLKGKPVSKKGIKDALARLMPKARVQSNAPKKNAPLSEAEKTAHLATLEQGFGDEWKTNEKLRALYASLFITMGTDFNVPEIDTTYIERMSKLAKDITPVGQIERHGEQVFQYKVASGGDIYANQNHITYEGKHFNPTSGVAAIIADSMTTIGNHDLDHFKLKGMKIDGIDNYQKTMLQLFVEKKYPEVTIINPISKGNLDPRAVAEFKAYQKTLDNDVQQSTTGPSLTPAEDELPTPDVNPDHAEFNKMMAAAGVVIAGVAAEEDLRDPLDDIAPELVERELPESAISQGIKDIVAKRDASEALATYITQHQPKNIGFVRDERGEAVFYTTAKLPSEETAIPSVHGEVSAAFLETTSASVDYGDQLDLSMLPEGVEAVTKDNGEVVFYATNANEKNLLPDLSNSLGLNGPDEFVFNEDAPTDNELGTFITPEETRVTEDGAPWMEAQLIERAAQAARLGGGLDTDTQASIHDEFATASSRTSEALSSVKSAISTTRDTMAKIGGIILGTVPSAGKQSPA